MYIVRDGNSEQKKKICDAECKSDCLAVPDGDNQNTILLYRCFDSFEKHMSCIAPVDDGTGVSAKYVCKEEKVGKTVAEVESFQRECIGIDGIYGGEKTCSEMLSDPKIEYVPRSNLYYIHEFESLEAAKMACEVGCSPKRGFNHTCDEEGYIDNNGDTVPIHYTCNYSKITSSNLHVDDQVLGFTDMFVNQSYAQTEDDTSIQSASVFLDSGEALYIIRESGVYTLEYEGEKYQVSISEDNVNAVLFIDSNVNGFYDSEDTVITENVTNLNLKKERSLVKYNLKQGLNFVSFPMVMPDYDMASELLTYLNETYVSAAFSIAKYDSSWKIVGENGGEYNVNDFQIIPGQGYIIKARRDITVELTGFEVIYESASDSAPIALSPGWNLLGLYGTGTKSYTAESFIDDINDYSTVNFNAVNVTRWPVDKGRYEGLQKEVDESGNPQVYGFDFPLYQTEGYFVRITEGQGEWLPKFD